MEDEQCHNDKKIIFVNKKKIPVSEDSLTGKQILEKAELDPSKYDLFLVHGQDSKKIEPNQEVEIKNDLHFNAILKSVPYG